MKDLLGFFDLRIIFRKIRKIFRAFAGDMFLAIDARTKGAFTWFMRGWTRSLVHAWVLPNSGCNLRLNR